MDLRAELRVHLRVAALAAVALLAAAGCAPSADDLLVRHGATDFPGQIVRGTLAGHPPCLGLVSPRGWTVLAWPARARATLDTTVVVALGSRVVATGATSELAGGFVDPGTDYELDLARRDVSERCPADAYFLVAEIGPW